MASAPWSPDEDLIVISHIGQASWLETIREMLPGRSEKALKTRMARIRAANGYGDGRSRGDADDWQDAARFASQALRDATLKVGMWL